MTFLGIDPGAKGGIALLDTQGGVLFALAMPESDHDLWEALQACRAERCRAVVEKVYSSPQMGVASAFSFGRQAGRVKMALAAARIAYDEVTPLVWQRRMQCFTEGDKNVSKLRARQLFPDQKITHLTADALLLAEYCRRLYGHAVVGDD